MYAIVVRYRKIMRERKKKFGNFTTVDYIAGFTLGIRTFIITRTVLYTSKTVYCHRT